mmetsp:Transcript_28232/g.40430  ORF Transcript_28232/g.40430 Transcript_28232/m.40430 type:complete len:441 (+) Transcript_28232:138-1460(+)
MTAFAKCKMQGIKSHIRTKTSSRQRILMLFTTLLSLAFIVKLNYYVSTNITHFTLTSTTLSKASQSVDDRSNRPKEFIGAVKYPIISTAAPRNNNTTSDNLVKLDLLVFLSGELGNNLLSIAKGKIIQILALEDGRFNFTLRYLWNGGEKSAKAGQEVQKCFSKHLSKEIVNLTEWNSKSIARQNALQNNAVRQLFKDWKDPAQAARMLTIDGNTVESIHASLNHLEDVRHRMMKHQQHRQATDKYSLSSPFVISTGFAQFLLTDKYYNQLHDFFAFNDMQCCRDCPDPDETVLHIRGFEVEDPHIADTLGFRDLDENRTSYELLGHLNAGEKVAIISRFSEEELRNYTGSLRERGIQTRFVTGHTGPQAFCFLKCATKGAVGDLSSTFFRTAVMLSDTIQNVTFYVNKLKTKRGNMTAIPGLTKNNWARKNVHVHVFDY